MGGSAASAATDSGAAAVQQEAENKRGDIYGEGVGGGDCVSYLPPVPIDIDTIDWIDELGQVLGQQAQKALEKEQSLEKREVRRRRSRQKKLTKSMSEQSLEKLSRMEGQLTNSLPAGESMVGPSKVWLRNFDKQPSSSSPREGRAGTAVASSGGALRSKKPLGKRAILGAPRSKKPALYDALDALEYIDNKIDVPVMPTRSPSTEHGTINASAVKATRGSPKAKRAHAAQRKQGGPCSSSRAPRPGT
jgi:hypothetical protein